MRPRRQYTHLVAWLERCASRPASVTATLVNKTWGDDGFPEYHKD